MTNAVALETIDNCDKFRIIWNSHRVRARVTGVTERYPAWSFEKTTIFCFRFFPRHQNRITNHDGKTISIGSLDGILSLFVARTFRTFVVSAPHSGAQVPTLLITGKPRDSFAVSGID